MQIVSNSSFIGKTEFITTNISNKNKASTDETILLGSSEKADNIQPLTLNNDPVRRERLQNSAREMLPDERKLGEFKDKDWVGEAKDFQIGPDIRFAVKSKNVNFLKRIIWGPLTSAEFREVTHRINELKRKGVENNNILDTL